MFVLFGLFMGGKLVSAGSFKLMSETARLLTMKPDDEGCPRRPVVRRVSLQAHPTEREVWVAWWGRDMADYQEVVPLGDAYVPVLGMS